MDRLQDGTFGYHFVAKAHEMLKPYRVTGGENLAPDASPFLLGTEGCNCPGPARAGSSKSWVRAERYAHDILHDLNNWASGWVDWNLLLNHEGGPNHLGNVCDAPILANADYSDVIVQPYLYVLGHFSRFLVPGSTIVSSSVTADFRAATPRDGGHSGVTSGAALNLWPCDYSSRQRLLFNQNGNGKLALRGAETNSDVGVDNDPGDSVDFSLCVASANNAVAGFSAQVIDCFADEWVARFAPLDRRGRLALLNPPKDGEFGDTPLCLTALPQYSEVMSSSGGGPIALQPCSMDDENASVEGAGVAAFQSWNYNPIDQALTSLAPNHSADSTAHCVTAGWPFVAAVAGVTPSGDAVTVMVNEASSEVSISLDLDDGTKVLSVIPPKSIQSFIVS
jgi:glucosylceramidase